MPEFTEKTWLLLAGLSGLLGATLVGIGEFTMQFNPAGGYEATDYHFFADISLHRLTFGHFFSVMAAPLYILGYWHLGTVFIRGGSRISGCVIMLLGGYSFVVATAWMGGRIYLALTAHAIATSADADTVLALQNLLTGFRAHNEPLVNVLRVTMLLMSVIWVVQILRRQTLYPRWMAFANPITILGAIFGVYFYLPAVGMWLLPAAMNVTHVIVFALSCIALLRLSEKGVEGKGNGSP